MNTLDYDVVWPLDRRHSLCVEESVIMSPAFAAVEEPPPPLSALFGRELAARVVCVLLDRLDQPAGFDAEVARPRRLRV